MSDGPVIAPQRPELVTDGVPSAKPRWLELATSSDHKDVGRIMIAASLCFLALALVEFLLMRAQLAVPLNDLIEPVTFNRLLSVWSATTVALFVLPFVIGIYTFVVPLQIGARSLAFPRLATLGLWLFIAGGVVLYVSFAYTPPETGFNPLPPLSDDLAFVSNNGPDVWITAVGLSVLGMVLQAVNLVVTINRSRAPGLAWRRLPPFAFSGAISSWLLIVVGPLMLAALTMLEIDRHYDGVFFDAGGGGAPVYYQHLSWIFLSGVYALMVLPAAGAISEIIPTFSGKPLLSRTAVAASMVAIAILTPLAWMQNMFTASIPVGWLYAAMLAAVALTVPVGLLFFNWLATLFSGSIRLRAPMWFALASLSMLSFGLAAELGHAVIPVNWLLADTADATAETGYVLVGGPILGGLAALHYWFPKMTGRILNESLGKLSLLLIFVGAQLTFFPMALAGIAGQPVDVYRFFDVGDLDIYNLLTTIGAFVLAGGIVVSLVNLVRSAGNGVPAGPDPWGGHSLEWLATSPPPPHNFDVVPDVRSGEPMRDIREEIAARPDSETRPSGGSEPEPAESGEPVA